MYRLAGILVLGAMVCLTPAAVFGQTPGVPGPPVPVTPQQQPPGALPPIPLPPTYPPPWIGDPTAPPIPPFPDNGNIAVGTPMYAGFPCAGYYGSFEISLLFPEIRGMLNGPVTVTGLPPSSVALGSANLTATGSPRIEVGYRLGDGWGAVAISYRSIVTKGTDGAPEAPQFGNPSLSSLININVVDIDYVSPAYEIVPLWVFSWRGGVRAAGIYFQNVLTGTLGQQEATSNFLGAGGHAEIEFGRAIAELPGLAVLTRLDGAIMGGNISQSFSETQYTSPPIGGATVSSSTEAVPVMTFDLGLTYAAPGALDWARFSFGYQFEYWWNIGTSGNSHNNLLINGLYFRGEFNF